MRQTNWWRAACGDPFAVRDPNRVLVMLDCADPTEAKVFRARAPPQCACENLVCALKLLAGEPADGRRQLRGHAVQGCSQAEQIEYF